MFDNMLFKPTMNKGNSKVYEKLQAHIAEKTNSSPVLQENVLINNNAMTNNHSIVNRSVLRRRLLAKRNALAESFTQDLFLENVYDIYRSSLLLDEDFVTRYDDKLYGLFKTAFNEFLSEGEYTWKSIKTTSSPFIQELYTLCEETGELTADKLVNMDTAKNAKISNDALINEKDKEETMEEADKEEVDNKTKDKKKAISKVIQDKVTKTVKKEKEASEKEAEEEEQIKEKSRTKKEKEADVGSEDENTDVSTTTDSTAEDETGTEENQKDEEGTEINKKVTVSDSSEDTEASKEDEKTKSESMTMINMYKLHRPNKLHHESLFRSIQSSVAKQYMTKKAEGVLSEGIEINMDLILAETISYYTLLETFSTLGLVNYTPSKARSLCTKLILM